MKITQLATALFVASVCQFAQAEKCPPFPEVVLSETKYEGSQAFHFEQWIGTNASEQFRRDLESKTPYLDAHRKVVELKVDVDPKTLLKSKLKFYPAPNKTRVRYIEIAEGRVGKIVELSCLEKALMEAHLKRYELGAVPYTEVAAHVYVHENDPEKFAVELSLGTSEGVVTGGQFLRDRISTIEKLGWNYTNHIHNHPFSLTNPYGDFGGSIVPSGDASFGDISVFLSHVKENALESTGITNGFNTTIFTADEIRGPISGWTY